MRLIFDIVNMLRNMGRSRVSFPWGLVLPAGPEVTEGEETVAFGSKNHWRQPGEVTSFIGKGRAGQEGAFW